MRKSLSRSGGWCIGWLVLTCVLAGCGLGPRLLPVSGKVLLGATPLTSGVVSFTPDEAKGNKFRGGPIGTIQSEGTYQMTTNGKPGAPAGWYKVTVSTKMPPSASDTAPMKMPTSGPRLSPKYMSAATTDLEVEVTENPQPGAYDLRVHQ